MIRLYELSKNCGSSSVLRCESRRFLRDVACYLSYDFGDATFKVHFPQSWLAIEVSEEFRHFVELVRSPHWLAEIQPNLIKERIYDLFDIVAERYE